MLSKSNESRADSLGHSTTRVHLAELWKAIHSAIRIDCAFSYSYRREAAYVRKMREGMYALAGYQSDLTPDSLLVIRPR